MTGQSLYYMGPRDLKHKILAVTVDDALLANRLSGEVLGRSLDALLPQTRQLLVLIDDHLNRRS